MGHMHIFLNQHIVYRVSIYPNDTLWVKIASASVLG